MHLQDNIDLRPEPYGEFKILSIDENDRIIDSYEERNLIVYGARSIMAGVIGAYISGGAIQPINKLVLGTKGHLLDDILNPVQVGEPNGALGIFSPERIKLYSQQDDKLNYHLPFDPTGDLTVDLVDVAGSMFQGEIILNTDQPLNSIKREITGDYKNVVRYTFEISRYCANKIGSAIAYTEAALYAGDTMFAMKTFPARVKEDTVKFKIVWSVIF